MDLNDLYHRYGVSFMSAKAAGSIPSRIVHETMANAYAKQIAEASPAAERTKSWLRWEAQRSPSKLPSEFAAYGFSFVQAEEVRP